MELLDISFMFKFLIAVAIGGAIIIVGLLASGVIRIRKNNKDGKE